MEEIDVGEVLKGYTLLLLLLLLLEVFDVDPLLLQLQLQVVLLPLAGMGTDNRDMASIEGGLLILVLHTPYPGVGRANRERREEKKKKSITCCGKRFLSKKAPTIHARACSTFVRSKLPMMVFDARRVSN